MDYNKWLSSLSCENVEWLIKVHGSLTIAFEVYLEKEKN